MGDMKKSQGDDSPADGDDLRARADEDDLRARFPDPDADARLRVPRGEALPTAPRIEFERPALPEDRRPEGGFRLRPSGMDLRGMGAASTIGITLVASIAIGTGFGWLVDTYLLRSTGTPWGLIVGFLLGTASGFINLVRVANALNRNDGG